MEIASLSYTYPGQKNAVIDDLTLSIEEGEYVALVGRNGSGKSTLLRLMDGLRKAGSGRVSVMGIDQAAERRTQEARSSMALVFQVPADQIVSSVVEEDVAFGPENLGLDRKAIQERVDAALSRTGLEAERKTPSHFLSAGQQQRLAIAGALALEPRCLAFDEATAMLDPPSRAEILDLMDGLNRQGVTILHATHDMAEAARASRLLALEGGRLVFDGSPEAFFAPASGEGPPALSLGLGLPEVVEAARALGLPPLHRESVAAFARRIEARLPGFEKRRDATEAAPELTRAVPEPGSGEAAFILESVSHAYLEGTIHEKKTLHEVCLSIPKGSRLALVGRTGSGKTSLLQLLDALSLPREGRVLSFGIDTSRPDSDLRGIRMRAPLAIQKPEAALFESFAADDVAFGPRNLGLTGKALVARVRESMEAVGLPFEQFRDRGTRALSGGEKRRLALAGVLALDPEALLLDEPTCALDPATKRSVLDLMESLSAAGKTLVHVTHSMEEAARADLVAVIVDGRVAALAPPDKLFYELFDPAWGIGRPFACELTLALGLAPEPGADRDEGAGKGSSAARPLDLAGLVALLAGTREAGT